MKVLHVFNYGWPRIDGYTIRSAGLVSAQAAELGWTTRVVTSPFSPLARTEDRVFSTPAWSEETVRDTGVAPQRDWERPPMGVAPVTGPAFRRALTGLVRDERPDIVHAHHPHEVGAAAHAAARAAGRPFVYELRCFNGDYDLDSPRAVKRFRGRRINALEIALARKADAVVTISDGLAARLAAGGVSERRIHVVRNSVDTDRFSLAPPRTAAGLHLGYATTFEQMENLDGLVAAIAKLRARRPDLPLRATLMGTGRDFDRIAALVAEAGLGDVVDLPGFVPYSQMPARLAELDLFVVPRRAAAVSSGTTPLKPLEALSVGLPILSSDLPALRELLGGTPAVQFVPPTPEGLSEGIERFADAPWPRATGIEERSWRREVHRYGEIYAAAGARP